MTIIAPQTILKNISGRPYGFFLDSASGPGKLSRYSFAGRDPFLVFKSKKDSIILEWASGRTERMKANPFFVLRELLKKFKSKAGSTKIPFTSGAVGYFGYDMNDFIERLPDIAKDDIGIPDCIIVSSF